MQIINERPTSFHASAEVSVEFEPEEYLFQGEKRHGYSHGEKRLVRFRATTAKIVSSWREDLGEWQVRVKIFGRSILKSGKDGDAVKELSHYVIGSDYHAPTEDAIRLEALRSFLALEYGKTSTLELIETEK